MKRCIGIFGLMALAGCAHAPARPALPLVTPGLEVKVKALSDKLALAMGENRALKRELVLYRNTKEIDSQKFVLAQDELARLFADEIAQHGMGLSMTDRGLVMTIPSEELFVSASASLSAPGEVLLDKVANEVQRLFSGHYIYIEGHTDNQSLAVFEWKSDWDFSFARALSVLKYFSEGHGMNPWCLSAAGFGQYHPRAANDTKEGRRLNRRVEIVISPQRVQKHGTPPEDERP
jgi:flagellar motor protein MotB